MMSDVGPNSSVIQLNVSNYETLHCRGHPNAQKQRLDKAHLHHHQGYKLMPKRTKANREVPSNPIRLMSIPAFMIPPNQIKLYIQTLMQIRVIN
ncbi:hypothetical protein Hanom_Chr12g01178551 [Helianthus anomalus]